MEHFAISCVYFNSMNWRGIYFSSGSWNEGAEMWDIIIWRLSSLFLPSERILPSPPLIFLAAGVMRKGFLFIVEIIWFKYIFFSQNQKIRA